MSRAGGLFHLGVAPAKSYIVFAGRKSYENSNVPIPDPGRPRAGRRGGNGGRRRLKSSYA